MSTEQQTQAPVVEAPAQTSQTSSSATPPQASSPEAAPAAASTPADPAAAPAVPSYTHEKKLRELYEKAHGMDYFKGDRDKIRETYTKYRQETEPVMSDLKKAAHFLKNKDYDNFFSVLGLGENEFMQHAVEKAKLMQMDPQLRAQIEAQKQLSAQQYDAQSENQLLKSKLEAIESAQFQQTIHSALSQPDVVSVAEAFDARVGQPGAFRMEVLRRGDQHFQLTGRNLPPEQVAREVAMLVGGGMQPAQVQAQSQAQQAPVVAPAQKPVIPNVVGRQASVVKKLPGSLDDLRKMAADMAVK
jgi:hypothetical protein